VKKATVSQLAAAQNINIKEMKFRIKIKRPQNKKEIYYLCYTMIHPTYLS